MTPRQSAAQHLPQLAAEWPELLGTFGPGVTLETLTTPDGQWGKDQTESWPRVNGIDLHRPWQPTKGRR